jgi:hypothetical protein
MSEANQERQDKDTAVQRAPAMTILAAEALRGATNGTRPAEPAPARGEERLSLFWRVFGGTLLSIAALVVVTLYQQFTSSINDLRHDIARLNEADANLVKKDEFNARASSIWSGLNDAKGANTGLAAVREKQALHEQQLKQADDERKELLRTVQALRERVAKLEGRQGGVTPAKATMPDIPD